MRTVVSVAPNLRCASSSDFVRQAIEFHRLKCWKIASADFFSPHGIVTRIAAGSRGRHQRFRMA